MNGHVTEWLGAYLDGELSELRRLKVQTHLEGCAVCRAELEGLRRLSRMLQSTPTPEFTPVDTFAARLALQLPRSEPAERSARRPILLGWLAPALLLTAWIFIQIVFGLSGAVGLLDAANLFPDARLPAAAEAPHSLWYTALVNLLGGLFDELPRSTLAVLDQVSVFAAGALGRLFWQALIALLYLAWLVVWWRRRGPQQYQRRELRS